MIPWLAAGQPFPDVSSALRAPYGLLAASSDLTTEQLITAYSEGIFPWYSEGEPVLWWSPDPRMVLYCAEFRVTRSLLKSLRRSARDPVVEIWIDRAFSEVMQACAAAGYGGIAFGDLNDTNSEISKRVAQYSTRQLREDLRLDPGVRYMGL